MVPGDPDMYASLSQEKERGEERKRERKKEKERKKERENERKRERDMCNVKIFLNPYPVCWGGGALWPNQ